MNVDLPIGKQYVRDELREENVLPDAMGQFAKWFSEAHGALIAEVNAMTFATVDSSGAPSARILLLKEIDARGFVFYTNYSSRKGRELAANPRAAMVFFWEPLERQVRVEGSVEKVSRAESEAYFHSRPRESQIGAWASNQSGVVASRAELDRREKEFADKFAGGEIPLPDFWGGYRLIPSSVEFWQGRPGRLHDRLIYRRQSGDSWKIQRLEP
jgi:pyridoxamine 5'-phosphate oxidase